MLVHSIPSDHTLAKLFFHSSDRTSGKTISKYLVGTTVAEFGVRAAWRIVQLVLRNINSMSLLTIEQVIIMVCKRVDILTTEHGSYLGVVVFLGKVLALLGFIIRQVENIEGSTTLVCIANLVFGTHGINLHISSVIFFFHVFPTLQITFVFLNPTQIITFYKSTYLLESILYYFILFCWSLLAFSTAAKSLLNLSFSWIK